MKDRVPFYAAPRRNKRAETSLKYRSMSMLNSPRRVDDVEFFKIHGPRRINNDLAVSLRIFLASKNRV